MPKTTNKRTPQQREADLVELAHLYLTGHKQADMGQRFGVSQQQISLDLKELRQRWLNSELMDFNEAKMCELAKIDALEQEAWEGYRRTVGTKSKRMTKSLAMGEAKVPATETHETNWEDAGDPRFLDRVAWCIQKRCEIFGFDAPKKIDAPLGGFGMPADREAALQQCLDMLKQRQKASVN